MILGLPQAVRAQEVPDDAGLEHPGLYFNRNSVGSILIGGSSSRPSTPGFRFSRGYGRPSSRSTSRHSGSDSFVFWDWRSETTSWPGNCSRTDSTFAEIDNRERGR